MARRVLEKCLEIKSPQLDSPIFNLEAWSEKPLVCLAECCYYCGEWDRSLALLDEALRKNPGNSIADQMRKEIRAIVKEHPEARKKDIPRRRIELPELMD